MIDPYRGKRYLKLVGTTDQCLLTFEQRVVYSVLTAGIEFGRGYNPSQIAGHTGLQEAQTVPTCIRALEERGLAERRDGRIYGKRPAATTRSWFRYFKDKQGDGKQTITYTRSLLPSAASPLTQRQNALYSLLRSFSKDGGKTARGLTYAYLGLLIPASRKTVADGVAVLVREGLLRVVPSTDGERLAFRLLPPTARHLAWFRDKDGVRYQDEGMTDE